MMTTLDPASITPEYIIEAAGKAGLTLMPSEYLHVNHDGELIGCCAVAALLIEADPSILESQVCTENTVNEVFPLTIKSFIRGLGRGFDGKEPQSVPLVTEQRQLYIHGFALGRQVRILTDPSFAEAPC